MPALRSVATILLIVGDAVAVEHRDQHRAGRRLVIELADQGQRGLQPRHADGEAGRRHRLAAEARHEAVVAPAAADRAEAHRAAFLVLGFEQQFNLVDRAGVVLEAADDGGIDPDSICPYPAARQQVRKSTMFSQLRATQLCQSTDLIVRSRQTSHQHLAELCSAAASSHLLTPRSIIRVSSRQSLRLLGSSSAPLVKSPLSSLRPSPKQLLHAFDAKPIELVDRAQHREPLARILFAAKPDRFHHAIEHLAVVHLHHVLAARMPSASIVSAAIMQISASAAMATRCPPCRHRTA